MALTNTYGSYSGNTLIGELGSRGSVPNSGFGGVQGVSYPSLTFIVEIDGQKYASSQWLAQQRSNPYKSQTTVAGAGLRIKLNDAIDVGVDNQGQTLEDQEAYAEVMVSKNLKSVDDVLQHIAWLVDENIDSLRTVTDYGNWEWKYDTSPGRDATTITDPLGNTYSIGITYTGYTSPVAGGFVGKYNADSDYKAIRPGLQFERGPFDGTKEGAEALAPTEGITSDVLKPVIDKDTNTLTEPLMLNPNTPIVVDPIDLYPRALDFGFGDINTDFGFGLGGDVSVGGSNQFTSVNSAGDDFTTRASTAYSGFVTDANDFNEPEVFGGLGSYNTDYSGQPIGALYSD